MTMSVNEEVFLRSGRPLPETADVLARELHLQQRLGPHGELYLGADGFGDLAGVTNARLGRNVHTNREIDGTVSALDGCDAVLHVYRPDKDLELQARAARAAFDQIRERLRWRCVLVHNVTFLVASWTPETGLHDYPERTTPDEEDRDRWLPWLPDPG
jgi:hypothetical protein